MMVFVKVKMLAHNWEQLMGNSSAINSVICLGIKMDLLFQLAQLMEFESDEKMMVPLYVGL